MLPISAAAPGLTPVQWFERYLSSRDVVVHAHDLGDRRVVFVEGVSEGSGEPEHRLLWSAPEGAFIFVAFGPTKSLVAEAVRAFGGALGY